MVSEISQSHKDIRHHSPYISGMQFTETESRTAIAGVEGSGSCLAGPELQICEVTSVTEMDGGDGDSTMWIHLMP